MFSIGDFARHGRVSVRMLRHYDAIGLLTPAFVDDLTGYRHYDVSQLDRLNRIVALKDLGFTLRQVADMIDDRVDIGELRGMLLLRRAELEKQIAADSTRLVQVESRLRLIEKDGRLSAAEVQVKPLAAVRVAVLQAYADGFEPASIGPVIRPLFEEVGMRIGRAGAAVVGPAIAYYESVSEGDGVIVRAALPVSADVTDVSGADVVDLPAVDAAATIIHHGSMDDVMPTVQTLAAWIDDSGYRSTGQFRELYLESDPDRCEAWVTELQEIVQR